MHDTTSGRRIREINKVLRKTKVLSHPNPQKAVECLEQLGPTFIKIGQIASNRSNLLKPEYCTAFEKLRARVPPMPFQTVQERLNESYGHPWQDVFAELDPTPLGSASIAQVHRARLHDGTVVAVKVRRPGIDATMEADITLMRRTVATFQFLTPANAMLTTAEHLIDELEAITRDELNFKVELNNLVRFYDDTQGQDGVTSPRPFPQFSTGDVLVMEFVDGIAVNDTAGAARRGYDLPALGERLVQSYVTQVVDNGFFHADPHPGNIQVRDGELVWLDLGMTGKLTRGERTQVGRIFLSIATGDVFGLKKALLTMCRPDGEVDHGTLLQEVDRLVALYSAVAVEDLNVGQAFVDLIDLLRKHNMTLPSAFTMLGRGLLTIEGVIAKIAPQTSLVDIITEHVRNQMACFNNAKEKACTMMASSLMSAQAMSTLPKQAADTLDMLQKGQVKIGMETSLTEKLRGDVHTIAGRLSLALISAALLLASAQLLSSDLAAGSNPLRVISYVMGFSGFMLSAYTVVSIIRDRHLMRNNHQIK